MARIVAYIPDLLFGSHVHSALLAAGHEVNLVSNLGQAPEADLLVLDLTADVEQRIRQAQDVHAVHTLAFYSHVEQDVRDAAERAGFDLVVPRSRMARSAQMLVEQLLASGS